MKLKLRASMRNKKRYLLIEGANEDELKKIILDYIGILGWARANPLFVRSSGRKIVMAVNREEIENIKASLALSSEKLKLIRTSGTLRGLSK